MTECDHSLADATVRELTWQETEALYRTQMPSDFPREEIKPLSLLRALHDRGRNKTFAFSRAGDLLAYAMFELPETGSVWLLDYLAVVREARGLGIGGEFLRRFPVLVQGADAILAEIEQPAWAASPAEREKRERRKRFYLKNGLIETDVCTRADGGVDYEILCLPLRTAPRGQEAADAMERLYKSFFSPQTYEVFPPCPALL